MGSLNLGKVEGFVFIIGIIVGIAGLFMLLPNSPITYNDNIELGPGEFLFSGYLVSDDDFTIHSIRVLEEATSMHIVLTCGSNDFDIYGSFGSTPSTSDYDFIGYEIGGEDFIYEYPEEGIWHFMVYSFSGSGQYELRVNLEY